MMMIINSVWNIFYALILQTRRRSEMLMLQTYLLYEMQLVFVLLEK